MTVKLKVSVETVPCASVLRTRAVCFPGSRSEGSSWRHRCIPLVAGPPAWTSCSWTATGSDQRAPTFFFSPSEVTEAKAPAGRNIRLGGLVEAGSVHHANDGSVAFVVTDNAATTRVVFHGDLPDLFREGQGIVANGTLTSRESFEATEVLAKHDETYMPPEVQEALERAGHPGAATTEEAKAGSNHY